MELILRPIPPAEVRKQPATNVVEPRFLIVRDCSARELVKSLPESLFRPYGIGKFWGRSSLLPYVEIGQLQLLNQERLRTSQPVNRIRAAIQLFP